MGPLIGVIGASRDGWWGYMDGWGSSSMWGIVMMALLVMLIVWLVLATSGDGSGRPRGRSQGPRGGTVAETERHLDGAARHGA